MTEQNLAMPAWSPNVIIADADYIDRVAFNLIVNFERMIGRPIPPADLAQWLVCVALDGGLRPMTAEGSRDDIATDNTDGTADGTQVVLIHRKDSLRMENFRPAVFAEELDGQAFSDRMGEFLITTPATEDLVHPDDFFLDVVGTVCAEKAVRRVMIIPNAEDGTLYDDLRETLRHVGDDKRVTVFTMQPLAGGNFRQELLGYSLMSALGIRADEIK